jgi:hypothetical protein
MLELATSMRSPGHNGVSAVNISYHCHHYDCDDGNFYDGDSIYGREVS